MTIAESKFYCFKIVANIFEVFYELKKTFTQ